MFLQELLSTHSPWLWVLILGAAFVATSLVKFILKVISSRLRKFAERTVSRWDNVFVDILDGLKFGVIFIWLLYACAQLIDPSDRVRKFLQFFLVAFSSYQIGLWGFYLIRNWKEEFLVHRMGRDAASSSVLGLMYAAIQSVFIVAILLTGLNNVGVDIGALIAGLGVGGIAVALAAQNILGDLLSSLSIVLDKPFLIGDFIIVGTEMGSVEKIGIKTTRVRSLSGEEIIFSNKDLLENRIHNYKRMYQRRVVQTFGVTYDTPPEKLESIPKWIRSFTESHLELRHERCHLVKFSPSSLDFEWVFWVNNPDQNLFMDLQQILLLDIMKKFSSEKIAFAFPTQTLHIENQGTQLPSSAVADGL